MPIDKLEIRKFAEQWETVRRRELEELRATSATEKLRQLAALMASARSLGWTTHTEAEIATVRERWNTLRRIYTGNSEG